MQVPVSEIVVKDVSGIDALRSLAQKFDPQKLASLLSSQNAGLITAGRCGVWVCPEFKNMIQICRGVIQGNTPIYYAYSVVIRVFLGCWVNNKAEQLCLEEHALCFSLNCHFRTFMGGSRDSWDCILCHLEVSVCTSQQ